MCCSSHPANGTDALKIPCKFGWHEGIKDDRNREARTALERQCAILMILTASLCECWMIRDILSYVTRASLESPATPYLAKYRPTASIANVQLSHFHRTHSEPGHNNLNTKLYEKILQKKKRKYFQFVCAYRCAYGYERTWTCIVHEGSSRGKRSDQHTALRHILVSTSFVHKPNRRKKL